VNILADRSQFIMEKTDGFVNILCVHRLNTPEKASKYRLG